MSEDKLDIDWSLTSWDGRRRAQLRHALTLTIRERKIWRVWRMSRDDSWRFALEVVSRLFLLAWTRQFLERQSIHRLPTARNKSLCQYRELRLPCRTLCGIGGQRLPATGDFDAAPPFHQVSGRHARPLGARSRFFVNGRFRRTADCAAADVSGGRLPIPRGRGGVGAARVWMRCRSCPRP